MCIVSETTLSCAHKHVKLLSLCPSTCHSGPTIITKTDQFRSCNPKCKQLALKQTLQRKYEEALKQISELSHRVDAIQKVLSSGKLLSYDFRHLVRYRFDADLLASMAKVSLMQVRSLLLEWAVEKMTLVWDLQSHYEAAIASITTNIVINRRGGSEDIVSMDAEPFEELRAGVLGQLYDTVALIERRASDACLEEMGWKLPAYDKEQCELLRELGGWKKGFRTGSWMDEAWCAPILDEMDTAPDEDPWRL
jgi:hypothetical protein